MYIFAPVQLTISLSFRTSLVGFKIFIIKFEWMEKSKVSKNVPSHQRIEWMLKAIRIMSITESHCTAVTCIANDFSVGDVLHIGQMSVERSTWIEWFFSIYIRPYNFSQKWKTFIIFIFNNTWEKIQEKITIGTSEKVKYYNEVQKCEQLFNNKLVTRNNEREHTEHVDFNRVS